MTTSTEPYVIRPSGLKGVAMRTVMRHMEGSPELPGTLLTIDTEGIHWFGVGDTAFVVHWDEIAEVVQQRSMGVQGLYVFVKDPAAVMARHPMKKSLAKMGPSPFVIPQSYGAKLEEVSEHIRRFSDVPIRKK